MLGFLCNLIINLSTLYYSGLDGKGDIPTWVIVMCALLYPLYHIFDLLDGKHARNTGQSSPLGLLMDHGVDSWTTFLFTMSLGSILKIENAFWYSFLWLLTSITFMTCTWEEYQTNRLDFPEIHGVSEGTFIVSGLMLFTAVVGQNYWQTKFYIMGGVYPLNNIIVVGFFATSMLFVLISFYKVYICDKTKSYFEALSNLAVFSYMAFAIIILSLYLKCEYVENYPKLLVYMFGFAFSQLVVSFIKCEI